jgi:hypothetical protein
LDAFRARALQQAREAQGAARVVLGGVSTAEGMMAASEPPRGAVSLPDIPLHPNQREAVRLIEMNRRACLVCGRRWGKSTVIVTLAVDYALSGRNVAIFAPTYRWLRPLFDGVMRAIGHLPGVVPNRSNPDIRFAGGSYIDFWSIDVTQRSGRGQKYHLVLVDEAAHDEGDYLSGTLEAAIARPPWTMRAGSCWPRPPTDFLGRSGNAPTPPRRATPCITPRPRPTRTYR